MVRSQKQEIVEVHKLVEYPVVWCGLINQLVDAGEIETLNRIKSTILFEPRRGLCTSIARSLRGN